MVAGSSDLWKSENQTPSCFPQNNLISQIHKKAIISLTSSILSLSDWGCITLEFDTLKSNMLVN